MPIFLLSAVCFFGISKNAIAPYLAKTGFSEDVILNIFFVLTTIFAITVVSFYVELLRKIFPDFMPVKKKIKLLKK